MASTFWSNTIYFVALAVLTAIQLIFAFHKTSNRKHLLVLFFVISGMTFSIEATIFCFFKAYSYHPMIFANLPLDDGFAGNLFSQFSIAATAVLIAAYDLKYYWYLIFACAYGIIEEIFLVLGIYSHNWYQTWMSLIGFPAIFWTAKKLYKTSLLYRRGWRYFFMFFGLYTLHMPTLFWAMKLSGVFTPNMQFFHDPMNSYAFISLMNLLLLSLVCMLVCFSKLNGWWKILLTLALYGALYYSCRSGILFVREGCFLPFATLDIGGMYVSISILESASSNVVSTSYKLAQSFDR